MSIRQQLLKEANSQANYQRQREDNRSGTILIFSMIVGLVNYVFWHDQFLKLDFKYDMVFIYLPMVLGVVLFYFINKTFIKNINVVKSSGIQDTFLSNGLLVLTSLLFAYFSVVTFANVLFKIGMNISTENKPIIAKTYVVEETFNNNRRRGVHLFSDILYLDENKKIKNYTVGTDDVETSNKTRKITFKCQQGFWGYYKILDYNLN